MDWWELFEPLYCLTAFALLTAAFPHFTLISIYFYLFLRPFSTSLQCHILCWAKSKSFLASAGAPRFVPPRLGTGGAALGVPWPSLGSQGCHTSADLRVSFQSKNWTMKFSITLALKSLYSQGFYPRNKWNHIPIFLTTIRTVSSSTNIFLFHCHEYNFTKRPRNNG